MPKPSVTPWEVSGKIDYDRLVKEFGTQKMPQELYQRLAKSSPLHTMLRRKFFFSHRDLDLALGDAERGKEFFLYSGRAPSGPMHIGHLLPLLLTKWFQDVFKANLYIEIPDEEKFLAKADFSLEEADKWCKDNLLDIAALGFDPDRTFIFQDREFIGKMYTQARRIAKKINFTTAKAVFGFTPQSNLGILFYPALQIWPTMIEKKRCLIPAAIDQDPYWRIQRDIAESLGYFKAAQVHCKFLPPLTGVEGKMSSSESQTAIYLNDDPKVVRQKIYKYAFSGGQPTLEEHRKKGGNPDIDMLYEVMKFHFITDDALLKEMHDDMKTGRMLTGEYKQKWIPYALKWLDAHQKKKKEMLPKARKILENVTG